LLVVFLWLPPLFKGQDHIQFNSMYVTNLKVAKDRHTLTSAPKFAGIANFEDVGSTKRGGGSGGGSGGVGGRVDGAHPHPR
jgi:hypothetical protein